MKPDAHERTRFQSVVLSVLLLPVCGCFSKTVDGIEDAAVRDESPINEATGPADCDPGYLLVPDGDYLIGSDPSDRYTRVEESPQWTARLAAFCMKRTEVTVAEFVACRAAGRCVSDPDTAALCNWNVPGRDNHPINCVNWEQASDYCAWAGGRLPTEAEWEGAARGPTWRRYPWGDAEPTNALSNFNSANGGTQEVAMSGLDRCNNPFGLCDMAGNVWEWVGDWMLPYPGGQVADPTAPPSRVDRGGGWQANIDGARSSLRARYDPSFMGNSLGFRCARSMR